jgi:hypothetical protein
MRRLFLLGAIAIGAAVPGAASAATASSWSTQADKVCVVFVAKAKREFGTPVQASGLYDFAVKAKTLESKELAELTRIPNADATGSHALGVMRADVAEVGAAIAAWDKGDKASFIRILKQYLNDSRAKAAFAAAGARKCG